MAGATAAAYPRLRKVLSTWWLLLVLLLSKGRQLRVGARVDHTGSSGGSGENNGAQWEEGVLFVTTLVREAAETALALRRQNPGLVLALVTTAEQASKKVRG